MDLRSILNAEDRPKLATRPNPASRSAAKSRQHRSSTDKTPTRPVSTAVKIEPTWSAPLTPLASPIGPCLTAAPWMPNRTPVEKSSSQLSINTKPYTTNKPKIITSNLQTSSTTVKRRASANSPISRTSSSCSSPSPPTPMPMTSIGAGVKPSSASHSRSHKRGSISSMGRSETTEGMHRYHQTAVQTSQPISMTPNTVQLSPAIQMPQVHLSRVLPLPMPKPGTGLVNYRHGPSQQTTALNKPTTPSYQMQITQPSSQRLCSAAANCDYTTPKRRIVSQFFGRNKKETRLIPRHCWVFYCRQHYQRSRYRLCTARFAELQMSLVHATVSALEKENIVLGWEVKLRKRALEKIAKVDREAKSGKKSSSSSSGGAGNGSKSSSSSSSAGSSGARERMLLSFCGSGKSFKHVYEVLDVVKQICRRDGGSALEFELLPSFTQDYQVREEERRIMCRAQGEGSDSESDDDD